MRIAIVSREVVPFFGAGIGTYAAEMARAWRSAGHEVHILSEAHPGFVERGGKELGGAKCHTVPVLPAKHFFAGYAAGVRRALQRLHAQTPFDYIEFPDYFAEGYFAIRARRVRNELPGAVLGVRLHTPTHECRLFNQEGDGDEEIRLLDHCEAAAIRAADVVISPSRSLLDLLNARIGVTAPRHVVPYPFRLVGPVSPAAATPRPTVLYFGRMERRKGVDLLIDAGQRLLDRGLDVSFRLIGGDTQTGPGASSMLAHLRSRIDPRHEGRFIFEARRPRHELFGIVRSVTAGGGLCCFPSIWENFANVCLEAMALGAPVVGSDAGGMSEIIEDGVSGVLFRSGQATSLADALERVLKDAALRGALTAAAPVRIAHLCDPSAVVRQMIAAIESTRNAPGFGQARGFDDVPLPPAPLRVRLRSLARRMLGSR